MPVTLLEKIRSLNGRFSKSDSKVAKYILEHTNQIIHSSIKNLANAVGVSEPTINRFSRKIGCQGFPDLKLQLAQEVTRVQQVDQIRLSGKVDTQNVRDKILKAISESVESIKTLTDIQAIDEATQLLRASRYIALFGQGASGSVALDAQHKFLRLGKPVIVHNDLINQLMLSAMLTEQDVLILISYTGMSKHTIEVAKLAHERKVKTIGITRLDSPMTRYCDVVLNAQTSEDISDLFSPMSSRIMHLVLVDILTTMLALDSKEQLQSSIDEIQQQIRRTRL